MVKIEYLTNKHEILKIDLVEKNDKIVVFEPENIIAFQSENLDNRVDKMDLKLKFKPDWKKSYLCGKSKIYVKSSNNAKIELLDIKNDAPFVFRANILLHTDTVKISCKAENLTNVIFVDRAFRYECIGDGTIAYCVEGESLEISLSKDEIIYIHPDNLIGFDKNIKYEINTYGTLTTASKMDYHYKFTGEGKIKIQTQSFDSDIKMFMQNNDNIIKRTLKEIIPGLGIIWK